MIRCLLRRLQNAALFFSFGVVATVAAPAADAIPRQPVLGLGHEYDLAGGREEFLLPDPLDDPSVAPDHPLYVRIRAPWALLEPQAGRYDWSEVDRIVDPYRAARYVVTLCLFGANPAVDPAGRLPTAANEEIFKAWLDFNRAAARHFKGRVRYYEIWDAPNREPLWAAPRIGDYAYLLKNTSVTLRSADPEALIVEGGLDLGAETLDADRAWQEALYREEIATYVDVLAVHPSVDLPLDRALPSLYDLLLQQDPAAQLWATRVPVRGEDDRARAADLLSRFIVAQGEGAAVVSFDLEADGEGRPDLPGVLLDIHKLFIPTYSRVPATRIAFEPFDAGTPGRIEGVRAYQFFDSNAFQGLVGFFAPQPPEVGRARMVLDTAAVRGVGVYDIVGGAAGPIRNVQPDFKTNTTRVPVFVYERPQVLQYARVAIQGFEAEKQQIDIKGTGLFTAEEVIAGHQVFMADQNARLKHYRAEARLTYHAKISGSNSIDIAFDNSFYLEKGQGAEWEQKALYYNGVLWKSKTLPELPIPQPEKVFTLPLDINLNKDYTYEYVGRDKVGEYDCHVIKFRPIDPAKSLYEGRAWIETRTFAPVKIATVQTNLKSPLVSSDEKDLFTPVAGPDGTTYWLLARVEGQQVLSVAGANLVLLRDIDFKEFQINDPGFSEARQRSYGSEHTMLRDTDEGLKYLGRTGAGERVVKEAARSVLLGLAGLYRQNGLEYPVLPLAGVDYLNFKVRGRDAQINAFLAGAFNTFTLTKPRIFGKRVDATVEALALAFKVTDQLYVRGELHDEDDVTTRFQRVRGGLGSALGNFFKIKGTYELEYDEYGSNSKTGGTFILPRDTLVQSGLIEGEFNRAAWTVTASAQRGWRRRWEAWGDQSFPPSPQILADFPGALCNAPGSCLAQFDAAAKSFDQYEFAISKQVFLPLFQKLRFEASWLTGSRLDRFSEFQFSYFGNRLRGLGGAGVRFDRGGIVRAQYAFNIADVVRFDASLDSGYVKDGLTSDRFDRFTGFGIAGNFMGPWSTIIQFDVGVALQSDIPGLRGDAEILLGMLKYFDRARRGKEAPTSRVR